MSNSKQPDTNHPFSTEFFQDAMAWFSKPENEGITPRAEDDEASTPRPEPNQVQGYILGQIYLSKHGNAEHILRVFEMTGPGENHGGYPVESADDITTDPSKEDDSKLELDPIRITYCPPEAVFEPFERGKKGDRVVVDKVRKVKDGPDAKFDYTWYYLSRSGPEKQ